MTNKERYQKFAEEITNKVIEQLNKGIIPWQKPFAMFNGKHNSFNSKQSYSILNQMLLDMQLPENDTRDYIEYATFNAIKKAGGKVNKGAKSKVIYELFIKMHVKTDKDGKPELDENDKPIIFPMYHAKKELIFDIELDTNLELNRPTERKENKTYPEPEYISNSYLEREKIKFTHKSGKAYYSPSDDLVNVPEINDFKNSNFYYSVLFHEITHSTGNVKRLNRLSKAVAFGNEEYSKEELVAEIGSYTLLNTCGLSTDKTEKNNIAYLQNWIGALQNDTTLFAKAVQQATKAVKFIMSDV